MLHKGERNDKVKKKKKTVKVKAETSNRKTENQIYISSLFFLSALYKIVKG